MATFNGGAAGENYTGTPDSDTIDGSGGNDTLSGAEGNDTIRGGADGDTLDGGLGNDSLYGDDGEDTLLGGAGDDYLEGGVGDDIDGGTDDLNGDEVYLNLRAMIAAVNVNLGPLPGTVVSFDASTSIVNVERGRIEFGSGNDTIQLG